MTEVAKEDGKLLRTMLDENDVFLVDADTTIYVWVGACACGAAAGGAAAGDARGPGWPTHPAARARR